MEALLPPGPKWPPILQGLAMAQLPRFMDHCHRKYGDRFTARMGPFGTFVYLVDPADIRSVFRGDDSVFHAGEANTPFLGQVLGASSVLCTDDQVHLQQRRRLSGPFHGESIARLAPLMAEVAARDIDTWPVGRPFSVLTHTRKITLEVILRAVIGVDPEDQERLAELRSTLAALVDLNLVKLAQFALPQLANYWPWTRYRAVQAYADRLIRDEIDRTRRDPRLSERHDVLAMLVRPMLDAGEDGAMSVDEVRDQLVTLLLAGHETTATGLAWVLERLTRHPAELARARQAARDGDPAYIDAVVTETLRTRPVVPDIARLLKEDVSIGEGDRALRLPAGTYVDPAIYLVMKSEQNYLEPRAFRPERFLGQRPDPNVWLPFGGGSRRCLGATFALTEMRVVLTEILQRVELTTTARKGERTRVRHVTLAPHRGARIAVRRRLVPDRPPVRDRGSSLASLSG